MMAVVLVVEEHELGLVSGYALPLWPDIGRKDYVYELRNVLCMHSEYELVVFMGDRNERVSWHVDGFCDVHGGHSIDQWNVEGRMLLYFCLLKELCLVHCLRGRNRGMQHSD